MTRKTLSLLAALTLLAVGVHAQDSTRSAAPAQGQAPAQGGQGGWQGGQGGPGGPGGQRPMLTPEEQGARMTDFIDQKVGLLPEQKEHILAINTDAAAKMQALRSQATDRAGMMARVAEFQKINQEREMQIEAMLTAEQLAKYRAAREEMRQNMQERMQERRQENGAGTGNAPARGRRGGRNNDPAPSGNQPQGGNN